LLLRAAREAATALDHRLAARLAEAAVDAGGGFGAEMALLVQLPFQGRAREALVRVDALRERAPEAAKARLLQIRANLHLILGEVDRADDVLATAATAVRDPRQSAWLRVTRAAQAFSVGQVRRSLELGDPLVEAPDADPAVVAQLASSRVRALCCAGRPLDGLALADASLDRLDSAVAEPAGARMFVEMARLQALPYSGRIAEGVAIAEARVAASRTGPGAAALPFWMQDLGQMSLMAGRPRTAHRILTEMLALMPVEGLVVSHQLWGLDGLAEAAALLGDAAGAASAVRRLEDILPSGFLALRCQGPVWAAAAAGELSRAREIARRHADRLGQVGATMQQAWALHDVARLGGAASVAAELAAVAPACQGDLAPLWPRSAAALAARDGAALDEVATGFAAHGYALWAAEASAAASAAHRDAGRRGSAFAASSRARRLADRCEGARTPLLALLDEPEVLTAREREVAGLAANGLPDKEIAVRLSLSVRTVQSHLHRAYRKLGIGDRAELADLLGQGP
jgi:DNA-binding NarL/FixJ family response regulator